LSRLQLHGRPFVVFDAKNKDHRRWFADFNQTGAWGRCPVRFVVNEDHGDLITMIQRELIKFYVDKEFGTDTNPKVRTRSVVEKQQKSVAQKRSKKVDNKPKKLYN
jgi:hypothetical protein